MQCPGLSHKSTRSFLLSYSISPSAATLLLLFPLSPPPTPQLPYTSANQKGDSEELWLGWRVGAMKKKRWT